MGKIFLRLEEQEGTTEFSEINESSPSNDPVSQHDTFFLRIGTEALDPPRQLMNLSEACHIALRSHLNVSQANLLKYARALMVSYVRRLLRED